MRAVEVKSGFFAGVAVAQFGLWGPRGSGTLGPGAGWFWRWADGVWRGDADHAAERAQEAAGLRHLAQHPQAFGVLEHMFEPGDEEGAALGVAEQPALAAGQAGRRRCCAGRAGFSGARWPGFGQFAVTPALEQAGEAVGGAVEAVDDEVGERDEGGDAGGVVGDGGDDLLEGYGEVGGERLKYFVHARHFK